MNRCHGKIIIILLVLLLTTLFYTPSKQKVVRAPIKNSSNSNYTSKFDSIDDSASIADQKAFFARHARNGTVTIVQANTGYLNMLSNMFCSLTTVNEDYLKSLVVWSTDVNLGRAMERQLLRGGRQFDGSGYFYSSQSATQESVGSGSDAYYKLMNTRGDFFLYLLETLEVNFLFLDSDIGFFRDPFPWIVANNGLGILSHESIAHQVKATQKMATWPGLNERDTSIWSYFGWSKFKYLGPNNPEWTDLIAPQTKEFEIFQNNQKRLESQYHNSPDMGNTMLEQVPDIIYGVDSRDSPQINRDPFRGSPKIPRICGGTFYVRSNGRSIALFKALRTKIQEGGNDQWSMDALLNERDTVMVGTLPRCTARSRADTAFCPEKGILYQRAQEDRILGEETLRVRILEYWQFTQSSIYYSNEASYKARRNSATMYKDLFEREDQELPKGVSRKVPVALHLNAWGVDKRKAMKAAGIWYLEDDLCPVN